MDTVAIVFENDWYGHDWGQDTSVHGVFVDEKSAFEFIYANLLTRCGDKEAKKARIAFRKGTREFKYYTWGNYEIVTHKVQS